MSFVENFFRNYDRKRDENLVNQFRKNNVNFTYNDVIRIRNTRTRTIFLEIGNARAGLKHILFKSKNSKGEWAHEKDFMKKEIDWFWVPKVVKSPAKGFSVPS